MRIEERRSREIETKKKHIALGNNNSISVFGSILGEEEKVFTEYKLDLEELKRDIDEAGEALEREPSLEEFNHFRDLIRALTKKVSKEAYRLRTVGFSFRKQYTIVATINEELNSLYRLVISEQKNHLSIANKVIKLRGLVVDVLS